MVEAAPEGAEASIRKRIATLELDAERYEQQQLESLLVRPPLPEGGSAAQRAADNLKGYLAVCEARLGERGVASLARLLAGAFAELTTEEGCRLARSIVRA